MATITPVRVTESGVASSPVACASGSGGDDFINTGQEFIRIQNTHATVAYSIKVSVEKTTCEHPLYGKLTKSNIYNSISSPGSTGCNSLFLGPFKQGAFNDATNKLKVFYKTLGTGTTDSTFDALSDLSGTHLLKIEVLYI